MLTIGVDVGGTSIKSALIEVGDKDIAGSYKILRFSTVNSQAGDGRDTVIANIVKSIERLDWQSCEAIAVATAGTVDWDSGTVTYATATIPDYTGCQLSKILSEHFSKRVVVLNDAVAALVGESFLGAGKKTDRILMFTIGTGLGASFLSTKILDGSSIVDTQLGHYILHEDGRECSCGQRGCAEQYVSATALKRYGNSNLYQLFHTDDIVQKKVLMDFYKGLTQTVARGVELYSPSLVVIGGGVTELERYWWQSFLKEYKNRNATPIAKASLGNKAGVLGSVYASIHGVFKEQ